MSHHVAVQIWEFPKMGDPNIVGSLLLGNPILDCWVWVNRLKDRPAAG